LCNGSFTTYDTDLISFKVTVLQTLDSGYAIVYTNRSFTSSRLYAIKLKNYKIKATTSQIPFNITTLFSTTLAQPTTNAMHGCHLKMHLLSNGSVFAADEVVFHENSANIRTSPLGGYALILQQQSGSIINFNINLYNESSQLFDYKFPLNHTILNSLGALDILQNNTML
ncbi:8510_t:CDS:2, partial [Racocetra persica]